MIPNQFTTLLRQIQGKGIAGQILRGGIGSIVLKVTNILLGLALAVILARVLGPKGYGTYVYVFALISILSVPAQFGVPRLVIRETAKAQVSKRWGIMRGLWLWSTIVVSVITLGVVIVVLIISWLISDRMSSLQFETFLWGLVLMPMIALGNLRGAALQGLRRVVMGQIPETVLRPGLFVMLVLSSILFYGSETLTSGKAMSYHVIVAGIAFIAGAWFLHQSRPEEFKLRPKRVYEHKAWIAAVFPLALSSGIKQINGNTDIVMLGMFYPADDVGIYRIAIQGAIFVVFGLQVIDMFISPFFARLHIQQDHARLQSLVTFSARVSFLTAILALLVFFIFGEELLHMLFGESYVNGYEPLIILAIGQSINALFGSVGFLLNMTGHERDMTYCVAISAVINIILNVILIPLYGMNGAAIATAMSLTIWNILLWRVAYKKLNIDSMAIQFIRF